MKLQKPYKKKPISDGQLKKTTTTEPESVVVSTAGGILKYLCAHELGCRSPPLLWEVELVLRSVCLDKWRLPLAKLLKRTSVSRNVESRASIRS